MRTLDLVAVLAVLAPLCAQDQDKPAPHELLVAGPAIELPHVQGRIDHLAIDLARQRLFVAALGNDSVEVVDLKQNTHLRSLRGPREPQGILYLPDVDRVVVACGGSGTCEVFNGDDLHPRASVPVGDDADNLRYDAQRKLVYVAYGDGALGVIDTRTWQVTGRIDLIAHPEGFQLDAAGEHAFVNLPGAHAIAVVDLRKRKVTDTWKLDEARANYPMAMLADGVAGDLVAVGCRSPGKLVLRSPKSGKPAGTLDLAADTDDLCLDAARHRLYACCGEGVVQVIGRDGDRIAELARVSTAPGARTALYVPERNQLFVAVPHRSGQRAEVRIFDVHD